MLLKVSSDCFSIMQHRNIVTALKLKQGLSVRIWNPEKWLWGTYVPQTEQSCKVLHAKFKFEIENTGGKETERKAIWFQR